MPYARKKYYSKRRYTGKRRKALYPFVKQVVQNLAETKEWLHPSSAHGVGWDIQVQPTWDFASIISSVAGGIAQGTNINQRIGDKIRVKSIEVIFSVTPNVASVGPDGTTCRIILWEQKRCQGTLPTPALVLTQNSLWGGANIIKSKDFRIVKEFTHNVLRQYDGTTATVGPMGVYKFLIYPNATVSYSGTSGITTEVLDNNWGIGCVADQANCCVITYNAKVRYTDF